MFILLTESHCAEHVKVSNAVVNLDHTNCSQRQR